MTPQLFINYKLKSVAHLPWRMLTYKALNTFIDDIFAFVIKMPTLYRIGCLRDGGYKLTEEWENWRLFFLAHQIEKSDVLPHVRNSYLTLVISPRSHPAFKCSFLTLVV